MADIYYFGSAGYYQVQDGKIVRLDKNDPEVAKAKASGVIVHGVPSATAEATPAPLEPAALQTLLVDLNVKLTEFILRADSFKAHLDEDGNLEVFKREILDFNDQHFKEFGAQISELAKVHATHDDVVALARRFEEVAHDVQDAKSVLEKLTTPTEELQTLRHDLALANAEIGSLQEKLTEAQAKVEANPDEVAQLQTVRDLYDASMKRTNELDAELTAQKAMTTNLSRDLDAANNRATDFEGKLTESERKLGIETARADSEKLRADTVANKIAKFGDPEELKAKLDSQPAANSNQPTGRIWKTRQMVWTSAAASLVGTVIGVIVAAWFVWHTSTTAVVDLAPLERKVTQIEGYTKDLQPTLNAVQSEMRTETGEVKDAIAKIPQSIPVSVPTPVVPPPASAPLPSQAEVSLQPAPSVTVQLIPAQPTRVAGITDPRCNNVPGLAWIHQIHNCAPWPPGPRR